MSPHEREKLVRGLLMLGMGLGLASGVWLITFVMGAPWRNSPPEPTPTLALNPQEEIERSAYYACAKQFGPSQINSITDGFDDVMSVEAWNPVPYPRLGIIIDEKGENNEPVVIKGWSEDNLYDVNLAVDYILVVVNRIPEYNYEETTRNSYRSLWPCEARYLGTENGIEHWKAEFEDPTFQRDCVHPSAYPADAKSSLDNVIVCK